MKKFYVTTPIYYVNDVPHIGHLYTTVIADVMARWKRLNGFEVFFLTGTDEHGAKLINTIHNTNRYALQNFCNKMSAKFKETWNLLNISYTDFIRTTEYRHYVAVSSVVNQLFKKGLLFLKEYTGLYCVGCERFYTVKDLDENQCCLLHKKKLLVQSEKNYFFKLSHFKDMLLERITNSKHSEYIDIQPEERKKEIIGKLNLGLDDISFSRTNINWGIPIPFDKTQTVYVWVDALINYLSGIGYPNNKDKFQHYWPTDIHFMAKDILWFHAVIWPAILMGIGYPLPKTIYSHGFFTCNGDKMSKSLNNVISPQYLVNKYGIDATRYLIINLIPFNTDGDISLIDLTVKYNTDLANNLGNLFFRIIKMIERYFNLNLPYVNKPNISLAQKLSTYFKINFCNNINNVKLQKALNTLQHGLSFVNKQIEIDSPWLLYKNNIGSLNLCISSYLQAIAIIAIHIFPFMPTVSQIMWTSICANGNIANVATQYFINNSIIPETGFLPIYGKVKMPGILFPRL
ncbi:MAG: methionine--tRNA ligase [Endomicrobium sp.]|jgi:methionyl-tRNA synthetase|nr:methionine--tRNA ligase [Endomicrobium sp.]